MSHNLKVVGAGRLGIRIALLWKQRFPEACIYFKTRSNQTERTAKWKALGFEVSSMEEEENGTVQPVKVPFVVFCAPPTGNPRYAEDIEKSIEVDRDTSGGKGTFVFTASAGVYSENTGGVVDESSPVNSTSERNTLLLQAEQKVLSSHGGIVIRFGGLYCKTTGAHNYWLNAPVTRPNTSRPHGLINLIHYDDGADCVVKALLHTPTDTNQLFLVSDGIAISRVEICRAAIKCPVYSGKDVPVFQGDETVDGKRYNTALVSNVLAWSPRFKSFAEFMEKHSDTEMNVDAFF